MVVTCLALYLCEFQFTLTFLTTYIRKANKWFQNFCELYLAVLCNVAVALFVVRAAKHNDSRFLSILN